MVASSSRRRRRASNGFEIGALQRGSSVRDGIAQQPEHQSKCREFVLLDSAVIVAFERFTDEGVGLALWS